MHADLSDDQFETVSVGDDSLARVKCQTGPSLQIRAEEDKGHQVRPQHAAPQRLARQANLGVPWINREKCQGNFGILRVSDSIVEGY